MKQIQSQIGEQWTRDFSQLTNSSCLLYRRVSEDTQEDTQEDTGYRHPRMLQREQDAPAKNAAFSDGKKKGRGREKTQQVFFPLVQVAKFQCVDHLLYPFQAINRIFNCTKPDSVCLCMEVFPCPNNYCQQCPNFSFSCCFPSKFH